MVNSESLSDLFREVDSEDESLNLARRDANLTHCLVRSSHETCSSLDKSQQVNAEDIIYDSDRLCTITDIEEKGNSRDEKTLVKVLVRHSDSSSLDLHLSSDSEERSEDVIQDPALTDPKEKSSEDCCLPESSSSSISSEKPLQAMTPSPSRENSPDMFANSQEEFSQDQLFDSVPTGTLFTSSEVLPDGSNDSVLSQADNRETEEEWSSQDLSNISKNLKIRRKQIKRLIAAVIRKRQMEDETLEAFKKRLKRM